MTRANAASAGDGETAVVFDVQRFSIHDGPGIRTVVFFKGCALDCEWCHNPEALRLRPELAYYEDRCLPGCEECIGTCPEDALGAQVSGRVDFARCTHCGDCADACPTDALVTIGREVTVDDLIDEVSRDREFFESSGGGVTVSGGEPVLHSAFLERFLKRLHDEGMHTVVETAGGCPYERLERLLPWVDLVLYDLKVSDTQAHLRFTGRGNAEIQDGLARLARSGTAVEVRMPVVPDRNTDDENISATATFLRTIGLDRITLLPYNYFWEAKLAALDTSRKPLGIEPPPSDLYDRLRERFASHSVEARC